MGVLSRYFEESVEIDNFLVESKEIILRRIDFRIRNIKKKKAWDRHKISDGLKCPSIHRQ